MEEDKEGGDRGGGKVQIFNYVPFDKSGCFPLGPLLQKRERLDWKMVMQRSKQRPGSDKKE